MKYDALYPDALNEFESGKHDKLPSVIKMICTDPTCEAVHLCGVCSEPATWANRTSKQYVCSTECNKLMWDRILLVTVASQIVRGP
jgi:hypothetical protein